MSWWEALLLGLVQGLTEFIPVSSSGHLVLGKYLLGFDLAGQTGVTFEVFVHFGTVLSIATVYYRRIGFLAGETFRGLARPAEIVDRYRESDSFRMVVHIALTLIPTGIVYVVLRVWLESTFANPRLAAGMLIVTGALLFLTVLRPNPDGRMNPWKALAVGLAQAGAMIPGISRSGATICTAIYQNVEREHATNFSFLMLLPVVLGATALKAFELVGTPPSTGWTGLALGTVAAWGSGVVAIRVVLRVVKRGNLPYFAYYCFAAGGLGLLLI